MQGTLITLETGLTFLIRWINHNKVLITQTQKGIIPQLLFTKKSYYEKNYQQECAKTSDDTEIPLSWDKAPLDKKTGF